MKKFPLKIGVIQASLPSYFPDRHQVFETCHQALEALFDAQGAEMVVAPGRPMNGREARAAAEYCLADGADFLLLIHGGFTMGDVARTLAMVPMPMGVWATPEPHWMGMFSSTILFR